MTFDKLSIAQDLQETGIEQKQAESIAKALREGTSSKHGTTGYQG